MAVNAPEAGVLKELLANEEDTVVVDQEIAKIDAGAAKPEGAGKSESTEAPKQEKKEASAPADAENKPESKESKPQSQPAEPSAASPPKKESPPAKQPAKDAPAASGPVLGSREERRVCLGPLSWRRPRIDDGTADRLAIGQNEPHASSNR